MKKIFLIAIMVIVSTTGFAQYDLICKKSGGTIQCKVREITLDVIKYERVDVKRGPIIQIAKAEVWKIIYNTGAVEIIDLEYIKAKKNDTLKGKIDSGAFSMLYVVYNSGQSSQVFPLIINGKYICRLSNHSRLAYKMFYQGELTVCRKMKNKIGPCRPFEIEPGKIYGISINVENEQALDPSSRFSMAAFNETESVNDFLKTEYFGFKPFKANDFHLEMK